MGRVILLMVSAVLVVGRVAAQEISLTLPQIWAVQGDTQMGSGQMTVTDAGGQPAAGGVVSILSSNSSVMELPLTQVQLSPQGQGTFTIRKHLNQGCPTVSLTATYQGTSASKVVPICNQGTIGSESQAAGVDAISLFRTEVEGGNPAIATITYNYGGQLVASDVVVVNLTSSNSSVASPPATVNVQGGMATVEIPTQLVGAPQTVTISAKTNSFDSKSATLTVRPPKAPALKSFALAPAAVKAGEGTIATLRLTMPAQRSFTANLTSSQAGVVQMQSSITFNAGESEKTFKVMASQRIRPQRVVLEALPANAPTAPTVKTVLEIK